MIYPSDITFSSKSSNTKQQQNTTTRWNS